MNYFGKNLKFLTKTRINQNQLSKKLGVTRATVNLMLKVNDPRASTLLRISEIFQISIDDLLKKDLESECLEKS